MFDQIVEFQWSKKFNLVLIAIPKNYLKVNKSTAQAKIIC